MIVEKKLIFNATRLLYFLFLFKSINFAKKKNLEIKIKFDYLRSFELIVGKSKLVSFLLK